ncbi:hypothetical protein [Halomonas sp. C05BenzN]|uniref:hypothetical protein n=1 Tax=Halomonas sp. C05BenzN TaxID=3411041 RepID=UPI003B94C441
MTLANDLLEQARILAKREPQRPKQASLRRAVSTAYYALFHLLVEAASREVVRGNNHRGLREAVARSLNHGDMKKVCRSIANWNPQKPPVPIATLLGGPPCAELVSLSQAFFELQQARHEADYDLSMRFSRDEVTELIDIAESAFSDFNALRRDSRQYRTFMMALMFHPGWSRV